MLLAVPRAAGAVKKGKKPEDSSRKFRYILCALLPMICIGAVQMWYNYDRFSVFEFGIQYSLTINDFTRTQFHSRLSLVPIYNYMFNPPVFSMEYPNISTDFQFLNAGGFFYADLPSTRNTSGLFFLALPMFAVIQGSETAPRQEKEAPYGVLCGSALPADTLRNNRFCMGERLCSALYGGFLMAVPLGSACDNILPL